MSKQINYISADDWAAVYVDGKVYHQGHRIPHFVWLEILTGSEEAAREAEALSEGAMAYDLADDLGRFPEEWSEVEAFAEGWAIGVGSEE